MGVLELLRKLVVARGKVYDISPEDAGWDHVGFGLYRLGAGECSNPSGRDTL